MIGISLFSNIGVAELGFDKNIKIVIANEIDKQRSNLYKILHPKTKLIIGDIKQSNVLESLFNTDFEPDFLISTPPCQGMSTAGKNDKSDPRNHLVKYSIDYIKKKLPKFILHENVPGQEKTCLKINGIQMTIPDYIEHELKNKYITQKCKVNMSNYGIPQNRIRSIYLFSRKDLNKVWSFPKKNLENINLTNAIGHLPPVDPYVSDLKNKNINDIFPNFHRKLENALKFSKYHHPMSHPLRQILVMQNTPTGKSAFENNSEFRPIKKNGDFVRGFKNTYKRMSWDRPAPTITTYNRTISSQENVHPGRILTKHRTKIYSDARVLTLLEIMILMTIPLNLDFPDNVSQSFIRSVIGEGIPPKFVSLLMSELKK